jgi:long-chain acyl-CoA synthetase
MVLQNLDIEIDQASTKSIVAEIEKSTVKGAAFEVVKKYRSGIEYNAFANLPVNLNAMYKTAAELYGDADFLIYKDERLSFNDLYQQASEFAQALINDYEVTSGDKVVIVMRNYPEWIIAFIAITSIGAIAVPVNAWLQKDELDYVIDNSDAKLVITDDKRYSILQDSFLQNTIPFIVARPTVEQLKEEKVSANYFTNLVKKYENKPMPAVAVDATAVATIFYTSGSTGTPKGAVSSHESILTAINTWLMLGTAAGVANGVGENPPTFAPAALMTVPLFHVTGCHTLFLLSMIAGRKTVMMQYWDATEALKLIEKEQITYFNGVPTMSMEIMNHQDKDKYDLSSLVDVCAGGAARPDEHVRKLYQSFSEAYPSCGYGLTETNALGSVNGSGDYIHKPSSAGLPTPPIVEVEIINANGEKLPIGEQGEIAVKSISNIIEYWKNPEATEDSFINGFFRTGDLGFMDEDGFIYIVDRLKDIIIRGGENISCLEVESAIYKHQNVKEVSVFALPDERLGEVVGALIYADSKTSLTQEKVQSFVAQHLAKFKVPCKMWFVSHSLPRLGSGKIDKRTIKSQYASNTADV